MYRITLSEQARKEYLYFTQSGNKAILNKIKNLLEDIAAHPYTGIGKPEPLKYELAGLGWDNKTQESVFENLDPQEQFFNAYQDWLVDNLPFLYEALRLSENKVITDCFWHDQNKGSQAKEICDILNKVLN